MEEIIDYEAPYSGEEVDDAVEKARTAYQKPRTGIPKADLSADVQNSLGKADTAIQKVKKINGVSIEGEGNIEIKTNSDLTGYLTEIKAEQTYQHKGDYALKAELPKKVSDLQNDKGYITLEQVPDVPDNLVTEDELKGKQDKLTAGDGIEIENNVIKCTLDTSLYVVVTELPAVGVENKIYLIESNERGIQNIYTEYAYINGSWEQLGQYRAEINLAPYALKTDIPTNVSELSNDADYITASEVEQDYQLKGNYALQSELPTKVSQLENDEGYAKLADVPDTEIYVLDFTISDGINSGAFDADKYNALRAAIVAGKLIVVGGIVTRNTADSQALAADYLVIRYATPRINDDSSVTYSIYELKFSATTYNTKAIHKVIK